MSRAQEEDQLMLKRGEQTSTEYEKGVVSRRFDHGGHDGVPIGTETNGNVRSMFTAI